MLVNNTRTMTLLFLTLLLLSALASAEERFNVPPFILILPSAFKSPIETVSFSGSTYTYLATGKGQTTSLTATLLKKNIVHEQTGTLDSNQCAKIFLEQIKAKHNRFFVSATARPMNVGGKRSPQFRWSGAKNGVQLTGVLTCVLLKEAYFILSLTDNIQTAAENFPTIRKSIRNITFR